MIAIIWGTQEYTAFVAVPIIVIAVLAYFIYVIYKLTKNGDKTRL